MKVKSRRFRTALLFVLSGILAAHALDESALRAASEESGIHGLKVGPSPFSPFVTASDEAGRTWQGVRIEFDVSSSHSNAVASEVQIYNVQGNLVRKRMPTQTLSDDGFAGLYSLSATGAFFGDRTLRRVYIWDGRNDQGRLCRNGRYFVRIFIDDSADKTFKTIPVVLFK